MFFHLPVFLYSLVYFAVIEMAIGGKASEFLGDVFVGHFWLGIFIVMAITAYFYKAAKNLSDRAYMTPIPVVYVISAFGLQYFLSSPVEKNVVAVLSAVGYYFIHIALYRLKIYQKDRTAHSIIAAGNVAAVFFFYSAAFGIYINFNISLWILMSLLALVTTLISFQYFWLIKKDRLVVSSYSITVGLVMAEIVWLSSFWPFGYLTTGAISLIFYYVFLDLVSGYFVGNLSKKRVIAMLIFFVVMIVAVLAGSPWLPVV